MFIGKFSPKRQHGGSRSPRGTEDQPCADITGFATGTGDFDGTIDLGEGPKAPTTAGTRHQG